MGFLVGCGNAPARGDRTAPPASPASSTASSTTSSTASSTGSAAAPAAPAPHAPGDTCRFDECAGDIVLDAVNQRCADGSTRPYTGRCIADAAGTCRPEYLKMRCPS